MSKPKPDRHAPQEVDAYLAAQAPEFRATLEQLRAVIKSPCGAPKPATVLISTPVSCSAVGAVREPMLSLKTYEHCTIRSY